MENRPGVYSVAEPTGDGSPCAYTGRSSSSEPASPEATSVASSASGTSRATVRPSPRVRTRAVPGRRSRSAAECPERSPTRSWRRACPGPVTLPARNAPGLVPGWSVESPRPGVGSTDLAPLGRCEVGSGSPLDHVPGAGAAFGVEASPTPGITGPPRGGDGGGEARAPWRGGSAGPQARGRRPATAARGARDACALPTSLARGCIHHSGAHPAAG